VKNLLAALLFLCLAAPARAEPAPNNAYDHVIATSTIRCAYGTSKPWIWIDAKDNLLKGLVFDIVNAAAKQLNLKLDWPGETGWSELPTLLYQGKADVACSTMWNDPARGRQAAFTRPLFYTAIYAYSRDGDAKTAADIDRPETRIVVQEGDFNESFARRRFPHASVVVLAPTSTFSEQFVSVATNKADVIISDAMAAETYNAANDKKVRKIEFGAPLAVYGNSFAVSIKEPALKEMIDSAVAYLLQTGIIDSLTADFRKAHPDAIVLPARPY
jgi:cyclohexadienyl dehydratase